MNIQAKSDLVNQKADVRIVHGLQLREENYFSC